MEKAIQGGSSNTLVLLKPGWGWGGSVFCPTVLCELFKQTQHYMCDQIKHFTKLAHVWGAVNALADSKSAKGLKVIAFNL